jgi:hypothetical protein
MEVVETSCPYLKLPLALVVVQFGKRLVSGHRFSDAGRGDNSERL